MSKIIHAPSGHTLFVERVKAGEQGHPAGDQHYDNFYVVKNWDAEGVLFFYIATGYHSPNSKSCKEVHVWYANGKMWSGFGMSFEHAISGAQKDGWMYASKEKA